VWSRRFNFLNRPAVGGNSLNRLNSGLPAITLPPRRERQPSTAALPAAPATSLAPASPLLFKTPGLAPAEPPPGFMSVNFGPVARFSPVYISRFGLTLLGLLLLITVLVLALALINGLNPSQAQSVAATPVISAAFVTGTATALNTSLPARPSPPLRPAQRRHPRHLFRPNLLPDRVSHGGFANGYRHTSAGQHANCYNHSVAGQHANRYNYSVAHTPADEDSNRHPNPHFYRYLAANRSTPPPETATPGVTRVAPSLRVRLARL